VSASLAERAADGTPPRGPAARPAKISGAAVPPAPARSGLPAVWAGRRRRYLSLLIGAGLGQAAAAGVSAHFFTHALTRSSPGTRGLLFGALVAAAVTVGLLRMAERILSERLSQDYVHQIRLGLIRRNLADGRVKSLGVAVSRTTNDLTSVKNWISQGVAPLAVGIPLILGVGIALALLNPWFLVGLVVPITVLLFAMKVLAPVAYKRTRRVRRVRGRLSSQVADTILSTPAIRSGGGSDRELARIKTHSQTLVAASIQKAKVAGAMRGVAAAMSGIATAMVIGTGLLAGLPTHTIAGALTIVAFLAVPLHDLGRVVEYRQTYRAARRIIGPAIEPAAASAPNPAERSDAPTTGAGRDVFTDYLPLSDGTTMPELAAHPGARVVVDAGTPRLTSELLERLVGLREAYVGQVVVSGNDLSLAGPKTLRQLVGYAAQGMMLARGSVSRTVSYRCPGTGPEEVNRLLEEVDLAQRVGELAAGADTILVHGGDPLTIPERARLLLARAILDEPPLLVFDHLDADLGQDGRATMRRLLADYPGVVILASDDPDQVITPTQVWRADGVHRITQPLSVGRRRSERAS
jgi:ABC-type multidrug transport system fused ATPase/permease subunit